MGNKIVTKINRTLGGEHYLIGFESDTDRIRFVETAVGRLLITRGKGRVTEFISDRWDFKWLRNL